MKVTVSLIAFATCATASAQSITTLYASDDTGVFGGGVYFDVTVAAHPLLVTSFDINTSIDAGQAFGFEVYTLAGTYSGNETNGGLWTLRSTGTGVSAFIDQPSHVTLSSSFQLDANTTNGMAIALRGSPGDAPHRYTNSKVTHNYSNGDVALSLGSASNVLFGGPVFTPRIWNGTIHYDAVPEPAPIAALALGLLAVLACGRNRRPVFPVLSITWIYRRYSEYLPDLASWS
jgi:hypothetical protein